MAAPVPGALADAQRAFAQGDHARVIALLRGRMGYAGAQELALLGNSAIALGQHGVALEALARLHARQPGLAPVARSLAGLYNLRGAGLRRAGREAEARADFERAVQLVPAHREAGYNLALALSALGQFSAALAQIDRHLAAHGDDAEARWLALEWSAKVAPATAAARLRDLAISHPADTRAAISTNDAATALPDAGPHAVATPSPVSAQRVANVALALQRAGEIDAARSLSLHAYELTGRGERSPGLSHALAGRLALPPVMASRAAIAAERARFATELAALQAEWTPAHLARCEPALEQLAWSNFHLAYHGENDRELQRAYAALIGRAAAAFAPRLTQPPAARGARRVGLLSSSFRDCTAGAYFGGWVDWLREAGFEVHVYQVGPRRDAVTDDFARRATRFVYHEGALGELAQRIRDDSLALLMYPELGMDARLPALAALRLAPRQAMGWGHPVTSGFDTIDAFFTCADMEPPGAEAHYTERLVRLPGLGVDYARPPLPPPATRADLGLPAGPLVLFPQSLFKIHPDDDALLADVARLAPAATFVMFDGDHPRWREQYVERLGAALAARIHWLTPGPRARYLQVNRACDLMLDTLRWSGGNTSLDALCSGLPVATCPGPAMRSRQTAAMLDRLGLRDVLVAPDAAALARRAASLLAEPARLPALAAAIGRRLPGLFEAGPARAAFVAAVEALCTPR